MKGKYFPISQKLYVSGDQILLTDKFWKYFNQKE